MGRATLMFERNSHGSLPPPSKDGKTVLIRVGKTTLTDTKGTGEYFEVGHSLWSVALPLHCEPPPWNWKMTFVIHQFWPSGIR